MVCGTELKTEFRMFYQHAELLRSYMKRLSSNSRAVRHFSLFLRCSNVTHAIRTWLFCGRITASSTSSKITSLLIVSGTSKHAASWTKKSLSTDLGVHLGVYSKQFGVPAFNHIMSYRYSIIDEIMYLELVLFVIATR